MNFDARRRCREAGPLQSGEAEEWRGDARNENGEGRRGPDSLELNNSHFFKIMSQTTSLAHYFFLKNIIIFRSLVFFGCNLRLQTPSTTIHSSTGVKSWRQDIRLGHVFFLKKNIIFRSSVFFFRCNLRLQTPPTTIHGSSGTKFWRLNTLRFGHQPLLGWPLYLTLVVVIPHLHIEIIRWNQKKVKADVMC